MKALLFFPLFALFLAGCGGSSSSGSSADNGSAQDHPWLIPADQVLDGGPGKDGIPSIDDPTFLVPEQAQTMNDNELVVGYLTETGPRAIPHRILDWHEIVNDQVDGTPVAVNYCPLTGSALLWEASLSAADPTYGVSGLLYNSNLILYDRETDSYWSQMLAQAVRGPRAGEEAKRLPLVETTWGTWRELYPDTRVMSTDTGFSRNYDRYPYGSFRTDNSLIFPVSENDERLHRKTRVLGIQLDNYHRVYPIEAFTDETQVINQVNEAYVVVGSAERNFAVAYSALLDDGTQLTFSVLDEGPAVFEDNEGTHWNLFGQAIAGPREGEQLELLFSYTAYWFAWAAFYPGTEIQL